MKRALPVLAVTLGVALVAYALFFARTEEERVRERLREVSESVAIQRGETPLVRAARVRKAFADIFAKDVVVAIPELGATEGGRAALTELAVSAPREVASVELDLDALRIRLDGGKERALAVGEAHLTLVGRDGLRSRDDRTVSIRADRVEGSWRIVDVTVSTARPGIERPDRAAAPKPPR